MPSLFVPGRLCLLGEHSDWAAGYRRTHPRLERGLCLVSGTDQGLYAEAEPLDDAFLLEARFEDGGVQGPFSAPARVDALDALARSDSFARYAAGAAAEVLARHPARGASLRIESDLPLRKGLSSSAAVCVLVVRALNLLYALGLGPREEMELAYRGERRTGSACGRMDPICALGRRTSLLHFDGDDLEIEPLEPGAAVHLLIVDLQRGKDTPRILADLNACFPDAPGTLAAGVREALGPRNRGAVQDAAAALRAGDAAALGAAMTEAQERFDRLVAPACPELAAPRLHAVLAHPAAGSLAFGGKGVGSQGDGCAQLVARGPEARDELARQLVRAFDVATLSVTLEPPTAEPR